VCVQVQCNQGGTIGLIKLLTVFAVACLTFGLSAVAPAQSGDTSDGADEYRLGPEDVIEIQVWGRDDLSGPVMIDFSGEVQVPLLGAIYAEGRTVQALSAHLTERFQLLDSTISEALVSVTQYNSRSITVTGEVRNPGRFGFRIIPDIWAVLLQAGGVNPGADMSRIEVIHEDAVGDETQKKSYDLSDGIDDTPEADLPVLRPKDTIVIPAIGEEGISGDKIYVLGAVKTPGVYRLGAAERIVEALAISGGALPHADLKQIHLTRKTEDGVVSYSLNLHGYLYDARPVTDFELMAGDVITVPASESTLFGEIMNTVLRLAPVITAVVSLRWIVN
jgi:polysaccharide biosynthesis/export protein